MSNNERPGYKQLLSGMLIHLLAYLFYREKDKSWKDKDVLKKIDKARLIIRERLNTSISPEEIAASLNMSYTWFRRMFRQYTGLAPAQYIAQLKVAESEGITVDFEQNHQGNRHRTGFLNRLIISLHNSGNKQHKHPLNFGSCARELLKSNLIIVLRIRNSEYWQALFPKAATVLSSVNPEDRSEIMMFGNFENSSECSPTPGPSRIANEVGSPESHERKASLSKVSPMEVFTRIEFCFLLRNSASPITFEFLGKWVLITSQQASNSFSGRNLKPSAFQLRFPAPVEVKNIHPEMPGSPGNHCAQSPHSDDAHRFAP